MTSPAQPTATPPLPLDLDTETAPLNPICAALIKAPADFELRSRCGTTPPPPSDWSLGLHLAFGASIPLDETPTDLNANPLMAFVADAIIEAYHLDPLFLRATLGYDGGGIAFTGDNDFVTSRWQWSTLTLSLGARLMLADYFSLHAGIAGAALLSATEYIDGNAIDNSDAFEPMHAIARVGVIWGLARTSSPYFGLSATIDLTPRAAAGEPGATMSSLLFGIGYQYGLDSR